MLEKWFVFSWIVWFGIGRYSIFIAPCYIFYFIFYYDSSKKYENLEYCDTIVHTIFIEWQTLEVIILFKRNRENKCWIKTEKHIQTNKMYWIYYFVVYILDQNENEKPFNVICSCCLVYDFRFRQPFHQYIDRRHSTFIFIGFLFEFYRS